MTEGCFWLEKLLSAPEGELFASLLLDMCCG